jgi:hypothetical protein
MYKVGINPIFFHLTYPIAHHPVKKINKSVNINYADSVKISNNFIEKMSPMKYQIEKIEKISNKSFEGGEKLFGTFQ